MNIATAYPKYAQIINWIRTFIFNRTENSVQLTDNYKLKKYLAPQEWHFMLPTQILVERTSSGLHLTRNGEKEVNVLMSFDWTFYNFKNETRSFQNDTKFTAVWGPDIRRVTLVTKDGASQTAGEFKVTFTNGFSV